MDARLDTGFESWGTFGETAEPLRVPGRLVYNPSDGLALELVESRTGPAVAAALDLPSHRVIYGRLIDGTLITLIDCITTKDGTRGRGRWTFDRPHRESRDLRWTRSGHRQSGAQQLHGRVVFTERLDLCAPSEA